MFNMKSYEEICKMSPDDIRAEMLQIWHDLDFNNMSEEESDMTIKQLKIYKEVYSQRQYEDRFAPS